MIETSCELCEAPSSLYDACDALLPPLFLGSPPLLTSLGEICFLPTLPFKTALPLRFFRPVKRKHMSGSGLKGRFSDAKLFVGVVVEVLWRRRYLAGEIYPRIESRKLSI